MDGTGYVLQRLFASVVERCIETIPHILVNSVGYGDPTGLRDLLQARSDINAITMNIVAIYDDVSQVDTDAK